VHFGAVKTAHFGAYKAEQHFAKIRALHSRTSEDNDNRKLIPAQALLKMSAVLAGTELYITGNNSIPPNDQ